MFQRFSEIMYIDIVLIDITEQDCRTTKHQQTPINTLCDKGRVILTPRCECGKQNMIFLLSTKQHINSNMSLKGLMGYT